MVWSAVKVRYLQKLWRWLVVLAVVATIYFLSDIPNLHLIREDQLPLWLKQLGKNYTIKFGTTGYFSYAISLHPDYILHKLGHIIAFGTLGISLYWAIGYSVAWAVSLTAIAATWDEWHQHFVTGRSSRFGDVVLDILAAIVFIMIVKYVRKKHQ